MLHFESDYMEGTHPQILKRLTETNFEKTPGYGTDEYCRSAKEKIREACGLDEAEVYFLSGGTQTNATVIDGLLRPYQGVISVKTGHISVHEAGAIESGGHKVLALEDAGGEGKLEASAVREYMDKFNGDGSREHMVMPGMVYISHPTEYGTLYTKQELEALKAVCIRYGLYLYLDGARLGYGLMARDTDVTLSDIAHVCDVFYIGGTKVGALFGEAVVLTRPNMIPHFFTMIKQHGALTAKGRLLGIQFDTLFSESLYFKIAKNAVDMAELLKAGLKSRGYRFFMETPTNQQFIILENQRLRQLSEKIGFEPWEEYDEDHTVVRLATSWATTREAVEELLSEL